MTGRELISLLMKMAIENPAQMDLPVRYSFYEPGGADGSWWEVVMELELIRTYHDRLELEGSEAKT